MPELKGRNEVISIGSTYTHHVQQALLYSCLVVVSGVRKVIAFFPPVLAQWRREGCNRCGCQPSFLYVCLHVWTTASLVGSTGQRWSHSDIETTIRYAYLAPDNARAGVAALERIVQRSTEGQNEVIQGDFATEKFR